MSAPLKYLIALVVAAAPFASLADEVKTVTLTESEIKAFQAAVETNAIAQVRRQDAADVIAKINAAFRPAPPPAASK